MEGNVNEQQLRADEIGNIFAILNIKDRPDSIVFSDKKPSLGSMRMKQAGNAYGVNAVMQVLCKKNKDSLNFLGRNPIEKALTRQWLEYNSQVLSENSFLTPSILRELDRAVQDFTFFGGDIATVADFFLYFSLFPTMKQVSLQDKEKYPNLCRWFRLIQEYDELRGRRKRIKFSRTPLYS